MKDTQYLGLRENERSDRVTSDDLAFNAREIDKWAKAQAGDTQALHGEIRKTQSAMDALQKMLDAALGSLDRLYDHLGPIDDPDARRGALLLGDGRIAAAMLRVGGGEMKPLYLRITQ